MNEGKLLLSVDQAAQRLSIGRSLCYELVMRGDIPSLKLGRRRLVSVAALEQFIVERLEEETGATETERVR